MTTFDKHKTWLLGKSTPLRILNFFGAVRWDTEERHGFAISRLRLGHPVGAIYFLIGVAWSPIQSVRNLFVRHIRNGLVWW